MTLPTYKGDIQALFWRPCIACECQMLETVHPISQCVACGHEEVQHKTTEDILPGALRKLVLMGKTNAEICSYLKLQQYKCSVRTLKRRLHDLGIKRNEEISQDCLLNAVEMAREQANHRAGYRQLHMMIRQGFNIPVRRSEVEAAARQLDPAGCRERLDRRCKKRVFECPGPDHLWSLDGHDKLANFGIYIHGCIDAFSRKILWCHTYTTNHQPRIVAKWFLDSVQVQNVIPTRLRMDPGTENPIAAEVQMYLRRNHMDKHAGKESVIIGDSKINQRIECFWSGMYNKVTSPLRTKFRALARSGLVHDPRYREAFIYIYLPLVKSDVDDYVAWWNNHRIRKQTGVAVPTGDSPDNIYYIPQRFDAGRYGHPIAAQDIETVSTLHNIPDELCDIVSPEFREHADAFLRQNRLHVTKRTAEAVFEALCGQ